MFGLPGLASVMLKAIPSATRYAVVPNNSLIRHSLCRCHVQVTRLTGMGYSGYLNVYRYSSTEDKNKSSLSEVKTKGITPSTFEQVKANTKTASYLGVIIIGLGVTGVMFYAIFRELFSSRSPNSVYSKALDRCCSEPRIQNALGEPIKGFGEETRRGRRRHVSHLFYEKDSVHYLRMKFYIQGSRRRGTVHLEMKEDDRGKFVYRYLLVQMDDYPHDTIILEDNRYDTPQSITNKPFEEIKEDYRED